MYNLSYIPDGLINETKDRVVIDIRQLVIPGTTCQASTQVEHNPNTLKKRSTEKFYSPRQVGQSQLRVSDHGMVVNFSFLEPPR